MPALGFQGCKVCVCVCVFQMVGGEVGQSLNDIHLQKHLSGIWKSKIDDLCRGKSDFGTDDVYYFLIA